MDDECYDTRTDNYGQISKLNQNSFILSYARRRLLASIHSKVITVGFPENILNQVTVQEAQENKGKNKSNAYGTA